MNIPLKPERQRVLDLFRQFGYTVTRVKTGRHAKHKIEEPVDSLHGYGRWILNNQELTYTNLLDIYMQSENLREWPLGYPSELRNEIEDRNKEWIETAIEGITPDA